MEGRDGTIQDLGDLRDRGGADRIVEQRGEDGTDLAGAEAAEEDAADEAIDLRHALLVAGEHGRAKTALAGAGDVEIGHSAPGGE